MVARARVVIVGAGFAGLWAARRLERAPVDVLVIDRNNYHTFLPLLYQVAASELGPTSIAYPVRSILRRAANRRLSHGGKSSTWISNGVRSTPLASESLTTICCWPWEAPRTSSGSRGRSATASH